MNDTDRLKLQEMIKANDSIDNTELIRQLKHSHLLQEDINQLLMLKAKHKNNMEKVSEEAPIKCSFLFTYYTDIFNKIKKDEIDLKILNRFLNVLRLIEDGELEQEEGSVMVGTLLKEMYIDAALKKADKLAQQNQGKEEEKEKMEVKAVVNISWKEWSNSKSGR
jgi:hypothetical protein